MGHDSYVGHDSYAGHDSHAKHDSYVRHDSIKCVQTKQQARETEIRMSRDVND